MMDDDDNVNGYGSLGGSGAEQHQKVTQKVAADGSGIEFRIPCDGCSKDMHIVAPWQEIIFMRFRQLPPNGSWAYNQHGGVFMPNLRCRCMGNPQVRLGVTPDECSRLLQSGELAGKITQAAVVSFAKQHGLAG